MYQDDDHVHRWDGATYRDIVAWCPACDTSEVEYLRAEVVRLHNENRAMQDLIDEVHGELDYLSPSTNGLEHGLVERLVAIREGS